MSTATASPSVSDWTVAPEHTRVSSLSVHLRRQTFVFPWHTFLFAKSTDDQVTAIFRSHEIAISGSGLSALISDLADQRVTSITEPDRTAKFRAATGPLITAISVTESE